MKTVLATAALTFVSAFMAAAPASAIEFRTPVARQLYTCAGPGLSRVALQTEPAPCCEGQLKCPQFLSTQGIINNRRVPRT
jgi:hypothetical protein